MSERRNYFEKRHYLAIAEVLKAHKPEPGQTHDSFARVRLTEWEIIVEAIADMFEADNPRFNAEKFYDACDM